MRMGLGVWCLLAGVASCGRIGFDHASEAVPMDAGEVDAKVVPIGPVTLTKLTTEGPIFKTSTDPIDDFFYLVATKGSQRASSFVFDSRIYFTVPSKSSDSSAGGWHYGMAHWAPGEASAVWVDGSVSNPGQQALISNSDLDANGFALRNHITTHFVQAGLGIVGLSQKYFNATEYPDVVSNGFYWTPIRAASPSALSAASIDVDRRKVIEVDDLDSTWRGETERDIDLLMHEGTLYVYQTQINAPDSTTLYIAVATSSDQSIFQPPTDFLLENYARPQVFVFEDRFYMVAYNYLELQWQLIPGSSPVSFDTSGAINLKLGSQLLNTGDWDDTIHFTDLPGGEPRLAGVDVLGGKIYLFYLAGGFSELPTDTNSGGSYHGVPYDGPRGIGVFELTINP